MIGAFGQGSGHGGDVRFDPIPHHRAGGRVGVHDRLPEALGDLTRKYKTIAIAGSHGKSTTTAMTALVLIEAGFDPTVIIGTKLQEFGNSNFRKGRSEWLIIEADEWKGSFWNYSPALAVINTNSISASKSLNAVFKAAISACTSGAVADVVKFSAISSLRISRLINDP